MLNPACRLLATQPWIPLRRGGQYASWCATASTAPLHWPTRALPLLGCPARRWQLRAATRRCASLCNLPLSWPCPSQQPRLLRAALPRRVDVYVVLTNIPVQLGGILGPTYPAVLPASAASGGGGVRMQASLKGMP